MDIFCTNRPSFVNQCFPISGIGDHDAVAVESSTMLQIKPPVKRTIYLWSRADLTCIQQTAATLCDEFLLCNTVHTSVTSIQICLKCLDFVPTKQVSTNSKQRWINCHIRRLSRRKQRYYNRARVSGSQSDWDSYKTVRKELQGECRKAYCSYINSLVSEDDSPTSKKLWSFIKKQKCDYCGVAPLEDCGTIHNEPQEKAVSKLDRSAILSSIHG